MLTTNAQETPILERRKRSNLALQHLQPLTLLPASIVAAQLPLRNLRPNELTRSARWRRIGCSCTGGCSPPSKVRGLPEMASCLYLGPREAGTGFCLRGLSMGRESDETTEAKSEKFYTEDRGYLCTTSTRTGQGFRSSTRSLSFFVQQLCLLLFPLSIQVHSIPSTPASASPSPLAPRHPPPATDSSPSSSACRSSVRLCRRRGSLLHPLRSAYSR